MFLLEEASYREFYKRYVIGNPFAIISAFDGKHPFDTNIANIKALRKSIRSAGYDQIKINGVYREDDYKTEAMIVFAQPDEEQEFLGFLQYFGKKYNQNSFLFVDNNSNIWLYSTKQNSTIGAIGVRHRIGDKFQMFDIDDLIMYYFQRTFEIKRIRIVSD